jgi:hypothetical protein
VAGHFEDFFVQSQVALSIVPSLAVNRVLLQEESLAARATPLLNSVRDGIPFEVGKGNQKG